MPVVTLPEPVARVSERRFISALDSSSRGAIGCCLHYAAGFNFGDVGCPGHAQRRRRGNGNASIGGATMNGKRGCSGGASLLARTWYGADRGGGSADAWRVDVPSLK